MNDKNKLCYQYNYAEDGIIEEVGRPNLISGTGIVTPKSNSLNTAVILYK